MGIFLTKKELANIAGYTYRQLHNIDRNLPEEGKLFVVGEGDKFDLAIFVQRWVEYNINHEKAKQKTLDEAKTEHEIFKMRKTELEIEKMEGRLVDVNEVRVLWGAIAMNVQQNMIRLPIKIAPMIANMENIQAIQGIIDREIRDILNQIADTPLPTNGQEDISANDEEQ